MREIFDKFEIVQQKLCEFESDGGDKFGSPKAEEGNESELGDEMAQASNTFGKTESEDDHD